MINHGAKVGKILIWCKLFVKKIAKSEEND